MPKKPNFLGGEQNYNKSTGEYEPNLVGPNGKVVKDADGDGVSHEKSKDKEFIAKYKGEHGSHRGWTDIDKESPESKNGLVLSYDSKEKALQAKAELEKDGVKVVEVAEEYTKPGDKTPKYVVYTEDERKEQDFNNPSERESTKLKEKEFNSKYDQIFDDDYQRSWGVPNFKDENDTEVLKGIIKKAEELGDDNILENAQERLDELESKQNKPSDKKLSRVPWSDKYSDDPTEWYFESYKDIEERILNGEIPVEFKDGEIDTDKLYEQIKGEYSDQLEDGTLEDMVYDATMDIDEKSYNKERKYRQSQSNKNEAANPEREKAIEQIRTITDRVNSYDADSIEGYLTNDEAKLIKDLAQKHKLTADDLKKIGGRTFADYGYGTDEFAYKEEGPEFLSKEYLDQLYEQANGDEDEITDLIRASQEYKTSEMTNSDLQGVVEAYMDKKTGKSLLERYDEKLAKQPLSLKELSKQQKKYRG